MPVPLRERYFEDYSVGEVLEFGDEQASPTVFSQSVHAAAASMVAAAAHLHGPTLTVADLAFPFEEALVLADAWLAADRCDAVLVVGSATTSRGSTARSG